MFEGKGRPQPGPCLTARCLSSSPPLHLLAASPLQHCCLSTAAIVSSPMHGCTSSATLFPATLQLYCCNRLFSYAPLQLFCNALSSIAATLLPQSSLLHCTAASPIQLVTLRRELSGILVRARCVSSTVWFTVVLGHQRRWCLSSSSKKFLLLKTGAYY